MHTHSSNTHSYTHTDIHTYAHTQTHTYIYTHTFTYKHSNTCLFNSQLTDCINSVVIYELNWRLQTKRACSLTPVGHAADSHKNWHAYQQA